MATALKKMAPQEWFALFARSARGLAFGLHETDFGDIQTYIALKRQETGQHARALLNEMLQEKGEASMAESSILADEEHHPYALQEPHPVLHAHRLAYLPGEAQRVREMEEADDIADYPTRIMTSIPIRLQASSFPRETEGDYVAETHLLVESAIIKYVSRYQAWPAQICLNPWRRLYGLERWLRYWWLLDRNNGVYADVISEQGLPEDVVECIPPSSRDENPILVIGGPIQEEQDEEVTDIEQIEIEPAEDEEFDQQPEEVREEEVADVETETPAEEVLPEPSQPEGEMVTHLLDDDAVGT